MMARMMNHYVSHFETIFMQSAFAFLVVRSASPELVRLLAWLGGFSRSRLIRRRLLRGLRVWRLRE